MRILVAGGAGFVGSHLVRELVNRGDEVVVIDDFSSGRVENLENIWGVARVYRGDVTSSVIVLMYGEGGTSFAPEVVVHLASPASPVDYDRRPLETLRANSLGTAHLAEIAFKRGARLVYASTSEVYGDPLVHPQSETYFGNVNPIGPRSCYDEGKRFGEALITTLRRTHGLRAAIVRPFNTYGPAMRLDDGRVIPALIGAALRGEPLPLQGGGVQTRSFMFIDDLVDGLLCVIDDEQSDGQVLNIGNPDEVTIQQVANEIIALTGGRSTVVHTDARPEDPNRRCPDITRMTARYRWGPTVDRVIGLKRTIDWYERVCSAGGRENSVGYAGPGTWGDGAPPIDDPALTPGEIGPTCGSLVSPQGSASPGFTHRHMLAEGTT